MTPSKVTRLFILAVLIVLGAWGAKFLLDFFGVGMSPFTAQVPIASDGVKMREEFRVWRHCSFEFGVRLVHEKFGELDAVLVDKTLPWTFDLNVYRLDDGSQLILHVNEQPTLTGKGVQRTIFDLESASLPRGKYRIEVRGAEPPAQLIGRNLEVFVQVRPKTTCGG